MSRRYRRVNVPSWRSQKQLNDGTVLFDRAAINALRFDISSTEAVNTGV